MQSDYLPTFVAQLVDLGDLAGAAGAATDNLVFPLLGLGAAAVRE